ncbi:hypothetical protein BH10BAC3_BH10BAC3_05540 [soil metagenome]
MQVKNILSGELQNRQVFYDDGKNTSNVCNTTANAIYTNK